MRKDPDNDRCLTDEEIGTLAIRLSAQRRGISQTEGRPAEMPGGLLISIEDPARAHLDRCDSCRGRLVSETRFYRAYFEPTDTAKADLAIRRRIESDLREELRGRRFKLLFFCPDDTAPSKELALAAATEPAAEASLIFAEREDESDLIFKKERDPMTGVETCYLVSGDRAFTENARVFIEGQFYSTNAKGCLEVGEDCPLLFEDSIIIVFPAS
jgi:hypothetical protein